MLDFLSPGDCWLDIDLCTPTLQKTYHIIIISILEFQNPWNGSQKFEKELFGRSMFENRYSVTDFSEKLVIHSLYISCHYCFMICSEHLFCRLFCSMIMINNLIWGRQIICSLSVNTGPLANGQ